MKSRLLKRIAPPVALVGGLLGWQAGCSDDPTSTGPNPDPEPQTGFIQVSTSTAGNDLDPDGYTVAMDGNSGRSIGLNGVITFSDVPTGNHQVQLSGLADNCSVAGSNPASASVGAGATEQVIFDVTCDALPVGSLQVTTSVTNNFDPDGYQVYVAGVNRGRVDVDGSATFDDLPAGAQEVELKDVAPNCLVDGENPATVTIPAGGSVGADFSVTCTSPPDGRIVYMGTVGGSYGIAVMNSDGSGKLLLRECQCWTPKWSPDGSRIAFRSHDGSHINLWTMSKDGSDLVRLTQHNGDVGTPGWSPDGSRLAFTWGVGDQRMIHIIDADGTNLTSIQPPVGYREVAPNWSPDGTRLAFLRTRHEPGVRHTWAIFVMDADGTNVQEVTPPAPILANGYPEYIDGDPVWSPDGSVIAFYRFLDADNVYRTFLVRPDGTDLVNLTPGLSHGAMYPSWSPDGGRIVFDGGNHGIYTMNADGSNVTTIDPPGSPATHPNWGR
jgi:Tol biopolymer transport system component